MEFRVDNLMFDELSTDQNPVSENAEDMEEGEISGPEDSVNIKAPLFTAKYRSNQVSFNPKPRTGIQITIDNKNNDLKGANQLPDLLREIGPSGAEALDRSVTERMDARAKRFNIKTSGSNVGYDDVIKLYESFNIPEKEYDGSMDITDRKYRLEAIQLTGLRIGTTADDILDFFGDFVPGSYEWENSMTVNVIWAMKITAAKALLCLSRPVSIKTPTSAKNKDDSDLDEELINVRHAEDENIDDDQIDDFENKTVDDIIDFEAKKLKRKKILEKFSGPSDTAISSTELDCDLPSNEIWRYAKPGTKLGDFVFMRIPRANDRRMNSGIFTNQRELITSGGLWSTSRKRRVQEALQQEKEFQMEYERRKKYNGPVGKNPWGTIAQDWTKLSKGQQLDFTTELELFKDLRGQRVGFDRPKFGDRLRDPLVAKDWDDPDNFEGDVVPPRTIRGIKRIRTDDISDDEDFSDEIVEENQDSKWNKKLKRPRMTMVADAEETKMSAKRRILKGVKRRINNAEKVEIYEEDVEDGERSEEEAQVPRGRGRMAFQVESMKDRQLISPHKRLSERFLNRLGTKVAPRQVAPRHERERDYTHFEPRHTKTRLPFRGHDSGDSLERDTGEDLRAELDGKRAANMVIQVTRSPQRDEQSDEEMEQDDESEEEPAPVRKSNQPMSIVKIKQEPIRIKNEQEEEMRKIRKRREEEKRRKEIVENKKKDVEEKRQTRDNEMPRKAGESRKENVDKKRIDEKENRRKEVVESKRKDDKRKERDEIEVLKDKRKGLSSASSRKMPVIKTEPGTKRKPGIGIRIKKEKKSDDSSSSSDSSEDESSSGSSSSGSSGSSSSGSSSGSSSSSSSSSGSSSDSSSDGRHGKKKTSKKPVKKLTSASERNRKSGKDTSDTKKKGQGPAGDGDKLKNKLKEYLNKARERRKKD